MPRYLLTSKGNAERRGLAVPERKSLHVLDTAEDPPKLVFSSNSSERAGKFEATAEDAHNLREQASGVREKANGLRDQAVKMDQEASGLDSKAGGLDSRLGEIATEERRLTRAVDASQAIGIGAATAAAVAIVSNALIGHPQRDPSPGLGALGALLGIAAGYWIGQSNPRVGASVAAAGLTLGWMHLAAEPVSTTMVRR